MRELSICEMSLVCGGDNIKDTVTETAFYAGYAGGARGVYLTAKGLSGDVVKQGAARGSLYMGSLVVGMHIGSYIYENSEAVRETAIGTWGRIDNWTGGLISGVDQSGNNYDGVEY